MQLAVQSLVQHVPQKRRTRYSPSENFAEQFMDGTANLAIDLRIKGEDHPIRVWIAIRSEAGPRVGAGDLTVEVTQEEEQSGRLETILADIAIENVEAFRKAAWAWGSSGR